MASLALMRFGNTPITGKEAHGCGIIRVSTSKPELDAALALARKGVELGAQTSTNSRGTGLKPR